MLFQSPTKTGTRPKIIAIIVFYILKHVDGVHKRPKTIEWSGSHCLYAYGFRFYFTPLSGVLFAFPSRYWFTIGRQGVFSLGGWSPHVQTR